MNTEERKYRFSEIMSAVSMLPDVDMQDDSDESIDELNSAEWVLPNLTKGFEDSLIRNAVLCQALRENDEFKFKLVAMVSNSALTSIRKAHDEDSKPNEADLQALAVSANVLWADGQATALYQLLGMIGTICASSETQLPTLATTFLRPNGGVNKYAHLDPFVILEGNVTMEHIKEALLEE